MELLCLVCWQGRGALFFPCVASGVNPMFSTKIWEFNCTDTSRHYYQLSVKSYKAQKDGGMAAVCAIIWNHYFCATKISSSLLDYGFVVCFSLFLHLILTHLLHQWNKRHQPGMSWEDHSYSNYLLNSRIQHCPVIQFQVCILLAAESPSRGPYQHLARWFCNGRDDIDCF